MAFRGNYEHTLDAKNRLTIPSRLRVNLAGGFVIAQALDQCASIWTPDAFEGFVRTVMRDLNPLSQEAARLSRYFNGNSFDGELDSAGRLMVPQPILVHAQLGKEVMIVGRGDHLELWNAQAWVDYDSELHATVGETVEKIVNPS